MIDTTRAEQRDAFLRMRRQNTYLRQRMIEKTNEIAWRERKIGLLEALLVDAAELLRDDKEWQRRFHNINFMYVDYESVKAGAKQ